MAFKLNIITHFKKMKSVMKNMLLLYVKGKNILYIEIYLFYYYLSLFYFIILLYVKLVLSIFH